MNWSELLTINWGQWLPIAISCVIALTGLYLALDNRRLRKARATLDESAASETIAKSALLLVVPMQKKITELEHQTADQETRLTNQSARLAEMERGINSRDLELEGLRAGLVVLTNQLRRMEIIPEYTPPIKVIVSPLEKKA